MKRTQIKFKIMAYLLGTGLVYMLILILFSSYNASRLGNEIIYRDAEFFTHFLIENVKEGLQDMKEGDESGLEKTLDLIKESDVSDNILISDSFHYNLISIQKGD